MNAADTGADCGITLSVIVPVYNEEDGLMELHARLSSVLSGLGAPTEIVYVNDGSRDRSGEMLRSLAAQDSRVKSVQFSRNFGKEAAMTAGLDHASGAAVILMDADLQDPPELIAEMVRHWQEGADIVLMQRSTRLGESWLKRWTARQFYRVMQGISNVEILPDVGDFRLLSRRAVQAVRSCGERTRFMKGLFSWVGYRQVVLRYERDPRFAGATKWNYWRLWNFALEGITSFSTAPLKIASYAGFLVALSAFCFGVFVVVRTLLFGDAARGYPTLITVTLFLGGVQLLALGVIGEYLARVFIEVKRRPLYIVDTVDTVERQPSPHGGPAPQAREVPARAA